MQVIKHYIQTSDGQIFDWDGYSEKYVTKARQHEISVLGANPRQARKQLKFCSTYQTSDGTIFENECSNNSGYRQAYQHQTALDSQAQSEKLADLADLLYCGNMTKDEYTDHLFKNFDKLQDYFLMNRY